MLSLIFKNSVGEIQENALIINNTTILADDLTELDYFEIQNIKKLLYLNITIALALVLALVFHWLVVLFMGISIFFYSKYFQFTDYFIVIGVKNRPKVIVEKNSTNKKEEIINFIQKFREALKS